jgi:NADH-quinone oxidoreductase subunit N
VIQSIDYAAIAPALVVALAAIGVLVLDLFVPAGRKDFVGWVGIAGLVGALGTLFPLAGDDRATFCVPGRGLDLPACSYVADDLALVFQALVLAGAVVVLLLSLDTVADSRLPAGEYSFLLLASVSGAVTLAASRSCCSG